MDVLVLWRFVFDGAPSHGRHSRRLPVSPGAPPHRGSLKAFERPPRDAGLWDEWSWRWRGGEGTPETASCRLFAAAPDVLTRFRSTSRPPAPPLLKTSQSEKPDEEVGPVWRTELFFSPPRFGLCWIGPGIAINLTKTRGGMPHAGPTESISRQGENSLWLHGQRNKSPAFCSPCWQAAHFSRMIVAFVRHLKPRHSVGGLGSRRRTHDAVDEKLAAVTLIRASLRLSRLTHSITAQNTREL